MQDGPGQLLRIHRGEVGFGTVHVDGGHLEGRAARRRPHLVEAGRRELEALAPRGESRPFPRRGQRGGIALQERGLTREVEGLADGVPRRRFCMAGRVAHELMDEGQEDGLKGEIVPGGVDAARPHQNAALAHRLARQRHRAVVEPGEHAVLRLQPPIAEEAGGREVAAVRAAEQVEHGMAVIEVGESGSPIRGPGAGWPLRLARRRVRSGRRAPRASRHRPPRTRAAAVPPVPWVAGRR